MGSTEAFRWAALGFIIGIHVGALVVMSVSRILVNVQRRREDRDES